MRSTPRRSEQIGSQRRSPPGFATVAGRTEAMNRAAAATGAAWPRRAKLPVSSTPSSSACAAGLASSTLLTNSVPAARALDAARLGAVRRVGAEDQVGGIGGHEARAGRDDEGPVPPRARVVNEPRE